MIACKRFVNAPKNARVIINSGATESIATCVNWARSINPYGVIYGTDFDHSSVKDNCKNFEMEYQKLGKRIPRNASMLMLTHVSGSTGEYIDMENFTRNFESYTFLSESDASVDSSVITEEHRLRQYKPLIVLDASQSVTKLRIDMEKWNLNAVFWSMHKIGGAQGLGVLVINDDSKHKFRPLIGGSQQSGLRGGTLGLTDLISAEKLLKMRPIKTSQAWKAAVDYLKDSGMDVVIPTKQHLFNTILIRLKHCPLGVINRLAKKQIYVGAISACALEQYIDNPQKAKEEVESFIRLSFVDPLQVDRKVLTEIIAAVKQAQAQAPAEEQEIAPAEDLILGGLGEEEEEYLTEIAFA